jgi:hypothetical protein
LRIYPVKISCQEEILNHKAFLTVISWGTNNKIPLIKEENATPHVPANDLSFCLGWDIGG